MSSKQDVLDALWAAAKNAGSSNTEQYIEQALFGFNRTPIGRVHDWRNYVPHKLRQHWDALPLEARLIAFTICENMANREEWD